MSSIHRQDLTLTFNFDLQGRWPANRASKGFKWLQINQIAQPRKLQK
jgi:hypothetical protein